MARIGIAKAAAVATSAAITERRDAVSATQMMGNAYSGVSGDEAPPVRWRSTTIAATAANGAKREASCPHFPTGRILMSMPAGPDLESLPLIPGRFRAQAKSVV